MGQLVEEVKVWNTPLVGSFLLWRFTEGYIKNHINGDAPIGILLFIASAILTSDKYLSLISDKRPNLQSFIRSFEEAKDADLLVNIQERIRAKKQYTLQAIDIGIAEGLLVWDFESGKIYSKNLSVIPKRGKQLKEYFRKSGNKAEILGKWFSQHDLNSIVTYLKVVL